MHPAQAITVSSYNILVPHWAGKAKPCLEQESWVSRSNRLVNRVTESDPDIICLQEVEKFDSIQKLMASRGFQGTYCPRNNHEEEGCAIFYKQHRFEEISRKPYYFNDGTGRLALMVQLRGKNGEGIVNVWSTHIMYQRESAKAVQELDSLAKFISQNKGSSIVCGDFNLPPSSKEINAWMKQVCLQDAHQNCPQASFYLKEDNSPGLQSQQRAIRIDYIFVSPNFQIQHALIPRGDNAASLLTAKEPSDHLPIFAALTPVPQKASDKKAIAKLCDLASDLAQDQFDAAMQRFNLLPKPLQNLIYEFISLVGSERKLDTSSPEKVSNELKKSAVQRLQEGLINLDDHYSALQAGQLKEASELLPRIPDLICNKIHGKIYQIEQKNNHPKLSNPAFGKLAFNNEPGFEISYETRMNAIFNFFNALSN